MSVFANIFYFDVISIKCWIRTIRKDFVKMSINVFDVCYATNLLRPSFITERFDSKFLENKG